MEKDVQAIKLCIMFMNASSDLCVVYVIMFLQLRSEEYEEALNLAREYDLDTDMVYQRQWQGYQVSSSTIQDYLVSYSCMWGK